MSVDRFAALQDSVTLWHSWICLQAQTLDSTTFLWTSSCHCHPTKAKLVGSCWLHVSSVAWNIFRLQTLQLQLLLPLLSAAGCVTLNWHVVLHQNRDRKPNWAYLIRPRPTTQWAMEWNIYAWHSRQTYWLKHCKTCLRHDCRSAQLLSSLSLTNTKPIFLLVTTHLVYMTSWRSSDLQWQRTGRRTHMWAVNLSAAHILMKWCRMKTVRHLWHAALTSQNFSFE